MRHLLSRRILVWATVAAVGALSLTALSLLAFRAPLLPGARVRTLDIEQHVIASGRVWVPTRVQMSAQVSGIVLAVGAVEGQRVRAGDLLVQLGDAEARAAASQAQAAVHQAEAKVSQLRTLGAIVTTEELRQANTHLDHARADLSRHQALAKAGAVSPEQLEEAQRAVDIARAQTTVAQAQQWSSAPQGTNSKLALSALLQAQAQLEGANARLAQTRVVATHEATVLHRDVEPGEVIQPGKLLFLLANEAPPELIFYPDERNLPYVALGQKARASADAYPSQVFDARVSYIAPAVDADKGSFEVRLQLPAPPAVLRPDMTVSVDLTVARAEQALVVPSEAIRGADTAAPFALLLAGGRLQRRDVKLGIRGDGSTQVVSGLQAGDQVAVPGEAAQNAGQRARLDVKE